MLNTTPTSTHDLKTVFVANLKKGERVTTNFMVAKATLEPFRDPAKGKYLALTLSDKTGQIGAKVWEIAPEDAGLYKPGGIVKVQADVREFNERLELTILKIRAACDDEYDPRDYLPATDANVDDLWRVIHETTQKIQNRDLYALVQSFFGLTDFNFTFTQAPATRRVHHAYLGGLLEQTVEMIQLADILCCVYAQVDRDLLRTGILLAHVGKVREFQWTAAIEHTDEGELLGHLYLTAEMIDEAIRALPGFPRVLAAQVKHLIAAQSMELEYGTARRPMTLEAVALAQLIALTSKVNQFATVIAAKPEGELWTTKDSLLGRALFAPLKPIVYDDADAPTELELSAGEAIGEGM